ncbi:MAG TPA: hypothetical protein VGK19_12160 [Capsulimonadaceae bacterium]|jgi:hypothetical protein
MITTEGFDERTKRYFTAAALAAHRWYDSAGHWIGSGHELVARERYWLSFALYAAGEHGLADAVVRNADVQQPGKTGPGSTFDIFHSNIAVALLVHHRARMANDVVAALEAVALDGFGFKPGDRSPEFQFYGYNDNMPAKANAALVLGGEMFGQPELVDHALWNLRAFAEMFHRRGINSEYNSPTYTPLLLQAMAEIVEHARCDEAREIALKIEQRVWIDVASRFHPEMGLNAGPHSRAYTADLLGSVSCLPSLLWFVLGDAAKPSPMELFDQDLALVLHHEGDVPFNVAQQCWFGAGRYHIPDAVRAMFAEKAYPFKSSATYEVGEVWQPGYPARAGRITSYLDADFTVGTASTPWLDGNQATCYFATYKRVPKVSSSSDFGTIYTRMFVNDDVPGALGGKEYAAGAEESFVPTCAITLTLQSGPTAMVLTHPSDGGAIQAGPERRGFDRAIRKITELIVIPAHHGCVDEALIGSPNGVEHRVAWDGDVRTHAWIAVRCGELLAAFLPLAYSVERGAAKVKLETMGRYQVVSVALYEGEERQFTRKELGETFGGFIAEHASIAQFGSLAAFADALPMGAVQDYWFSTRHTRYCRPASMLGDALDLHTAWGTWSFEPRFATVNGEPESASRVDIDGIDSAKLPFLDSRPPENVARLPWRERLVINSDF